MGCISSSNTQANAEEEIKSSFGNVDDISDIDPIPNVLSQYQIIRPLGVGGSCRVVEAHLKSDKSKRVAMKIIDRELPVSEHLYKREVRMLVDLTQSNDDGVNAGSGHDASFPKIVPFVGHGYDDKSYYVLTRLLTGGEVIDRLLAVRKAEQEQKSNKMTEAEAINVIRQMLLAVKYCHERNIVHRDLKPENFMHATADPDSSIVLIDFGCAKKLKDDEIFNDIIGTAYFMAPELALARLEYYRSKKLEVPDGIGTTYKAQDRTGAMLRASDIWAVGVIAYVLVTGHRPFRGYNNIQILNAIVQDKLLYPRKDGQYYNDLQLNPLFIDFTQKVLVKDPTKRMSIEECLKHPWVRASENSDHKNYQLNSDVVQLLKQFKQQTRLKKEITRILARDMNNASSKKNIESHFERIDNDGDGYLNEFEITILLLDMGYNKFEANKQAKLIISSGDKDNDGKLDKKEFTETWYRKVLLKSNDAIIQSIFDIFDTNGDGFIDQNELNAVLFRKNDRQDEFTPLKDGSNDNSDEKEPGAAVAGGSDDAASPSTDDKHDEALLEQLKQTKSLIEDVDQDGDGKISFEEFKKAMKEDIEKNGFDLKSLSYGDTIGVKYGNEYD